MVLQSAMLALERQKDGGDPKFKIFLRYKARLGPAYATGDTVAQTKTQQPKAVSAYLTFLTQDNPQQELGHLKLLLITRYRIIHGIGLRFKLPTKIVTFVGILEITFGGKL